MKNNIVKQADISRILEAVNPCYKKEVRVFLNYCQGNGLKMASYKEYM